MEHLFELFEQTSGVSIDTRKIEKDCLFICLKGENFDGNTFADLDVLKTLLDRYTCDPGKFWGESENAKSV